MFASFGTGGFKTQQHLLLLNFHDDRKADIDRNNLQLLNRKEAERGSCVEAGKRR